MWAVRASEALKVPLEHGRYVVVDLETTGGRIGPGAITEFGACQLHHAAARRRPRRKCQPRKLVHQVQPHEVSLREAFEHPIERRLELTNQARLVQGRIERGGGRTGFNRMDVTDELGGFRVAGGTAVEVRRDPIAQARAALPIRAGRRVRYRASDRRRGCAARRR